MNISLTTKQAYSEVDEYIELLTERERNKVPEELRTIFKEEKDSNYFKGINPNIPIKDQDLKSATLAIIALLYLNYWCIDNNEKNSLMRKLEVNDKIFKENFQVDFDFDNIFKKRKNDSNEFQNYEENKMVKLKENSSFFTKIIEKMKKILNSR